MTEMLPKAVEAAAKALSLHTMVDDSPENEKYRDAVRREARAALIAAYPYLAAHALREAAFKLSNMNPFYAWLTQEADIVEGAGPHDV